MAVGKGMKKSFYTDSQGAPTIEMPPLPEQSEQSVVEVPNQVPDEVYEEMDQDVQEVVEEEQSEEVEQPELEKKTAPKPQDSFRAIREAKEKAEKERDALLSQMLEYQRSQQYAQPKQPELPPIDDDINFDIDEDGLVEGRYVKKVANRIKNLEKQLKAYESQSAQQSVEAKIKQQFPDFDQVVSTDNVEILNAQFPEIARSLRDTSDLYSKAVSAYNIMKRFGIHRDDPHAEERIRALRNTQKPKPIASISPQQGDSPLSKANAFANGLTEDLKAQLRREMSAARKAL